MTRVLVAEDDTHLRRALNLRLRAHGYETTLVEDGLAAIAAVRAARPDVLLLDLGLPHGDGFVVMERVAHMSAGAAVPVIVITGRDPEPAWRHARELGAVALLSKPVDNTEMLRLIQEVTVDAGARHDVS